jgi:hypothetical protein
LTPSDTKIYGGSPQKPPTVKGGADPLALTPREVVSEPVRPPQQARRSRGRSIRRVEVPVSYLPKSSDDFSFYRASFSSKISGKMSERKEPDFASLLAEARAEGTRAARELQRLASEVNAEDLFAAVFAHLVLAPAGTADELTHGAVPIKLELLAFHLLPFFSAPGEQNIDAFHIARALDALDSLFVSS